ncbi:MAG: hypothetical protein LUC89_01705 [Oscillospiraceae bacterium]|nr:hypothetical protein [Oscillospiraceae bacterium]
MGKKKKQRKSKSDPPRPIDANLRLDPEQRLCARFDSESIAKYPVASREDMGFRVLDNCAEENQK